MDQWWLREDGEALGPGQPPEEIFGSLSKSISEGDEDPFLQRASEIRRSTELMNTDDRDLETLLYNRATCESPTIRDDQTSSHPDSLLLSDESFSPSGSSDGSDFTPLSPESNEGIPNLSPVLEGEHRFENEIMLGHFLSSLKENEGYSVYDEDQTVSNKKSMNNTKPLDTDTGNIDDVLNSFLAQCSRENVNGLFEEVLNLPKSYSSLSTSLVPPTGSCVTSQRSQAFPRDEVNLPMIPLTGEFTEDSKPRHASEESYLAPRPLLGVLTSRDLSSNSRDNFRCQFCSREFKHKIGLKNHERSHLRGETHICGYCGKSFRYKNKLRRHVNGHARQMRICRYCGEVQANDYELVQHEKRHKKDEKKLIDGMMDSFAVTNESCDNLDIVFTERPFNAETMILPSLGCKDQFFTTPYMGTAAPEATGRILTCPKPVRYHSV